MGFAEVVRRGLEEVVKLYPPDRVEGEKWELPTPRAMGEPLLPEDEWDAAGREEA